MNPSIMVGWLKMPMKLFSMEVAGTIGVKKDAVFTITKAAAGKTIALVTCTELVEGATFVGQPELVD